MLVSRLLQLFHHAASASPPRRFEPTHEHVFSISPPRPVETACLNTSQMRVPARTSLMLQPLLAIRAELEIETRSLQWNSASWKHTRKVSQSGALWLSLHLWAGGCWILTKLRSGGTEV